MGFRSLTEQMDTTTPQGAFLFSVFGALAQYERALARERIMAGLEAARKRGRRGGRPTGHRSRRKLEAILSATEKRRQQGRGVPQLRGQADDALPCPDAVRDMIRSCVRH